MTGTLTLLLNNIPFQTMEVEIRDFHNLPFEERCEAKKKEVEKFVLQLKALYFRQIIKTGRNDTYILTVSSKANGILEKSNEDFT